MTTSPLLELLVCGRFTSDDGLLYHQQGGWAPFSVKGPALPPEWDRTTPLRFDVNQHRAKRPVTVVSHG